MAGLGSRLRPLPRLIAGLGSRVFLAPPKADAFNPPTSLPPARDIRPVRLLVDCRFASAGLGSRERSLLAGVNVGIFFDSAGLGSRERVPGPVLIVMELVNLCFGSPEGPVLVAPANLDCCSGAGLGSRERAAVAIILLASCIRRCSAGLGSREVRVLTVGLGSRDRALPCAKDVPLDCLRYSLGAFC